MGREALVKARVDAVAGEVKALLESRELILRGAIRHTFTKAAMTDVRVDGPFLHFSCGVESVSLDLGPGTADAWAKAIIAPPPSLRAKLGLDKGAMALLAGRCDDPVLAEALDGVVTDMADGAAMVVACIDGSEDLAAACAAAQGLPIWAVYPKGKAVAFGDTAIRTALRAAGWRDTKSCAVSDRLTATWYNLA